MPTRHKLGIFHRPRRLLRPSRTSRAAIGDDRLHLGGVPDERVLVGGQAHGEPGVLDNSDALVVCLVGVQVK